MLDRTIAPDFQEISSVPAIPCSNKILDNGISLFLIPAGEQEVIRLELVYTGGSFLESKPGITNYAFKMLSEGTSQKKAADISEYIDQFGAFLEISPGTDRSIISLFVLKKYFKEMLFLLAEIIEDSSYPEKELDNLKNISLQNLKVSKQKNDFLASQKFKESLFGQSHPYGRNILEGDIESVSKEDLLKYYKDNILYQPFEIFLSGYFGEPEISLIEQTLGKKQLHHPIQQPNFPIKSSEEKKYLIEQVDSIQSSIRIGRLLFQRKHEDYFKMLVTNEVFGGYFGSRLMKNIRENKGFTYGIYSQISNLKEISYLAMATDVKREFTSQTLEEIHKEAKKMREELVSAQELELVRNYLLGSMSASFNTAFDLADKFKNIHFHQLQLDYYDHYIQQIKGISPSDIIETARKYLHPEEMIEVVAGGY